MEEKFTKKLEKLLNKAGVDEETIAKVLEVANSEPNEEVEPTAEQKGEEVITEEPKGEEPVEEPKVEEVAPEVEQAPVESQPQVDEVLVGAIEELKKANEGLQERLKNLEEALKKSKILTEEDGAVGIDQNRVPANDSVDDPMESVLNEINHRR